MLNSKDQLVIGLSSSALFDLKESDHLFKTQGLVPYRAYQVAHEEEILAPGEAFGLVQKIMGLNQALKTKRIELVLLSRNSSDTGLRILNSIAHYQLPIEGGAFTGGDGPCKYVEAFRADLFLSMNPQDVRQALESGYAAATILSSSGPREPHEGLKIAFDGDAVLFSDESERIFQQEGLEAFTRHEKNKAKEPLPGGPFKSFLEKLHAIQKDLPEGSSWIRTALVTARSAPAHERVLRTLRAWNIVVDEALFLAGRDKSAFLKAFQADIFFDDQTGHCESAAKVVSAAHVPHGIVNQKKDQNL